MGKETDDCGWVEDGDDKYNMIIEHVHAVNFS